MIETTITNGRLIVREAGSAHILWQGRVDGFHVKAAVALGESDDLIVLLDVDTCDIQERLDLNATPTAGRCVDTLIRMSSRGTVRWRADVSRVTYRSDEPKNGFDCFVAFELQQHRLLAWTWSCYMCDIDIENGNVLNATFTK